LKMFNLQSLTGQPYLLSYNSENLVFSTNYKTLTMLKKKTVNK
jgi:hypothetical protein